MITNICLLLEALTVVFCLHYLYGEKVKLDIETTSFLAINMIIMATINFYKLPKIYTLIVYPIIFLYCGVRFGFKIKPLIVNYILYLAILGGIQVAVSWIYCNLLKIHYFKYMDLLIINGIILLTVIILLPRCNINKLSLFLQDKERILIITLFFSVAISLYCLIDYKENAVIDIGYAVLLFTCMAFIGFLAFQLSKYKIKTKEAETELKMNKLYAASFQNLIESIRLKQHEFDNHLGAIFNQHYMYDTYEQLVKVQEDYCNAMRKENKYNKLLQNGNSVVIGFLYGKFVEIDKLGIELSFNVNIDELEIGIPVYKLVELIGNLIDNAVDALTAQENKGKLYVEVVEVDGKVIIEVRNESEYIKLEELKAFFAKDYSKKGKGRGLGLFNVNNICNEYMLYIACDNKEIEGRNWLFFRVTSEKETV